MPLQAGLFPVLEPLHLIPWRHEVLHLHLLELSHAEGELPGHYLVSECFTHLGDAERNTHAPGFLDIQEVDENALRGFGA